MEKGRQQKGRQTKAKVGGKAGRSEGSMCNEVTARSDLLKQAGHPLRLASPHAEHKTSMLGTVRAHAHVHARPFLQGD